ncbi:12022_t:CDS:1, partial [Gigaspora rosea]
PMSFHASCGIDNYWCNTLKDSYNYILLAVLNIVNCKNNMGILNSVIEERSNEST